jgi:hypothetical protein
MSWRARRPVRFAAGLLLVGPAVPAAAQAPSADALADALAAYRNVRVAPADLRAIACAAIAEEPSEFDCGWEERSGGRWVRFATWLARDGRGWTVLDDPLPVPAPRPGLLDRH